MATVTVKGIDKLTRRFNKLANMELKSEMNKAVEIVHGQAENLAPVDTGTLAGSIKMSVKTLPNGLQGRVYTNEEYAAYVEFGTGVKGNGTYPYTIKGFNLTYHPKGWAYVDEDTGEWVYTKGQEAQPYMYPALKMHENTIKAIFKNGVRTKVKGGK